MCMEKVGDVKKQESVSDDPIDIIANLEKKIAEDTTNLIKAYNKSVYALKKYVEVVENVVDSAYDVKPEAISDLRQKSVQKDEVVKEATKLNDEVTKSVTKLKQLLQNPNLDPVLVERAKGNIKKVQSDVSEAKADYEDEKRNLSLTDKYWSKVQQSRNFFKEELEALFPSISIEKKNMNISEGDLDLFVLHSVNQVLYYQKELAKLEIIGNQRLNETLELAKKTGNFDPLTTEQICKQLEKEKRQLEDKYAKKCLKLRQDAESELREKLKVQSEAFTDHLDDAVKTREMELEHLLSRKYDEKLEKERCKYKLEVSAMIGKLKGMEEALKARSDADKTTQQSQVLWTACQALLKSVKAGCPGIPWIKQLHPLEHEISAVKNAAASSDELVKVVTDGIPEIAKKRGVFTEEVLRERFLKVEQVAKSVALLPENGGGLHLYFLSYIQSLLLLTSGNPIPAKELNDEQVNFSTLNSNEVLQRARYWLDRGDFAQSLKYMNLLKGAPRSVAKQWMNETRILLETQQAANTLMAYAASSSLMYL